MKKILIVGYIHNDHINRLVTQLRNNDMNNTLQLDGFNIEFNNSRINHLFDNTFFIKKHCWSFLYNIRKIRGICKYYDLLWSFISIKTKYDICNVHFPCFNSAILLDFLIRKANKLVVSPWGSDVYRINSKKEFFLVKRLYNKANIITVPPIKFREDIKHIFKVPDCKIVNVGFGSEIIDILTEKSLDNETAKKNLGFNGKYVIVCGYNANPAQNHLSIIQSLTEIKEQLPPNTILIFPMTYVRHDLSYIKSVKDKLNESEFEYKIYEEYLDNQTMANLRTASDIFIHIQTTDAYSATIQEFLYTETVVFNGAWTRYPDLEENGIPYILVNKVSDLSFCLSAYFEKKLSCSISKECKEIIKNNSWSSKGRGWYNFYIS